MSDLLGFVRAAFQDGEDHYANAQADGTGGCVLDIAVTLHGRRRSIRRFCGLGVEPAGVSSALVADTCRQLREHMAEGEA